MSINAFTVKSNVGILPVLMTPIEFSLPSENKKCKVNGIWDTGATNSVINQKVVDELGLKPIRIAFVNNANEKNIKTFLYLVDIYINNGAVRIQNVNVTLGNISNCDCLIGMDIITLGDFSITNVNRITTFSFRIPSTREIGERKFVYSIKK
jgi:predicted aspartyl protease